MLKFITVLKSTKPAGPLTPSHVEPVTPTSRGTPSPTKVEDDPYPDTASLLALAEKISASREQVSATTGDMLHTATKVHIFRDICQFT